MTSKAKLKAQERATSFWKKCQRSVPSGPSKAQLRAIIAEAAANTPASADSASAVRLARQERHP